MLGQPRVAVFRADLVHRLRAHAVGDDVVHESNHHLVRRLVAERHFARGVGIVRVVRRVVEVRDALDRRALRQRHAFRQHVVRLPVEVVVLDAQEHLASPVGIVRRVREVLPAVVHVRREPHRERVLLEGVPRPDLVIRVARRNQEVVRRHPQVHQFLVDPVVLGEVQADPRLIRHRFAARVPVHVADQVRALPEHPAGALGEHHRVRPGRPRAHPPALRIEVEPVNLVHDHVVHHALVARQDFDGADPPVLRQRHLPRNPIEHVRTVRGDLLRRERHHQVRFAQRPFAACELRKRGHVLRIPARRAGVDPRHHRCDLGVRQAPVVHERAHVLDRVPRRHLLRGHHLPDLFRPRPHFLIRRERHRRHLTRPVTLQALRVQNRRDVLRVGRLRPERRPADPQEAHTGRQQTIQPTPHD